MAYEYFDKGATFSTDGQHRYALWRVWDKTLPMAMCIGLNPSKADSGEDDNTIHTLRAMLMKLGYGGFYMTNLFAYITANPKEILTCDAERMENHRMLKEIADQCEDVIFCWGAFPRAKLRAADMIPQYPNAKCFGKTIDGSPFHPRAMIYSGKLKTPQLIPYHNPELLTK